MKKTDSITKKLSFRQKSRFLATQQMLHRVVAILVLAFVCSGAWAVDYVIYDNGHFFAHGTDTNITSPTTFSASSCVWTTSGSTYLKNGSYGINSNAENPPSISIVNGNGVAWTVNGNRFGYKSGSRFYYLNNYNAGWKTARSNREADISSLPELLYAISQQEASLTTPTISGDEYISTTGNHDYSASATSSQTCYKFTGKTTYYGVEGGTLSETAPIGTVSYSWNITPNDYATINTSNGRINVTSIPNQDTQVTITVTASSGGLSEQSSKTITLTKSAPVAAGYVIYDGNGHYLGGTSTTAIGSFNPNTCLWTANNNKFQNGSNYLRLNRSWNYVSYTYSLNIATTNSQNTIALSGQESGTTGQKINVAYDGSNSRYVRYNSGWTVTNTSTDNGTDVVFSVIKNHHDGSNPTMPTISAARDGNTIKFTHTNITGTYDPTYDDYIFYNGTHHYWYDNANHDNVPASQSDWSGATYTWSIVEGGDYAEINSDGELTFKDVMPTTATPIKVRLSTSNISPLANQTVDYSFTLTPVASQSTLETPVVSCTGISSNGKYVTTTHTNVTGKYVPAYSTFTIGGVIYKYSGGTIYDNSTNLEQDWTTINYSFRLGSAGSFIGDGSVLVTSTANNTTNVFWKANATASDGTKLSKESAAFPIKVVNSPKVEPTASFTCSLASDNSGILLTPSLSGNTYTPEYGTVTAGDKTFYVYEGICHTDKPLSTDLSSGVTYTWTPTNGTVSTNNILTFNGTSPATVKLTATKGDYSAESATTNFTLTEEDPAPEAIAPDIVVTPKTATLGITNQPSLGYSNTQEFSIPETLEAVVKDVPAYTKIVSGTNTYYKHENGKYYTNTPAASSESQTLDFTSATWTASEEGYVSITPNANGKTATVVYDGKPVGDDNTRISITANATYGEAEKSGRAIVSLLYSYIDVTGITATNKNMFIGENDKVSLTITPNNNDAGIVYENFTYTVADESIATIDANGTIHGVNPGATTVTVTYSDADKPDHPALRTPKSASGASATFTVTVGIKAPTIKINNDGTFTITDNNVTGSGATIKYTTDGSDPVANGTTGTSGTVTTGQTVKAVAIKGDGTSKASTVVSEFYAKSGVSGDVIIINDYEDHTWTYYQPVADLPENYPTGYLHSQDPRNVKITYRGGGIDGASAVAISGLSGEGQNEMIYYKTLEKTVLGMTGNYPYQVISNPFSKRPKKNDTYYGFNGWKVVSGGEYIAEHANNDVLGLDEIIHFTNLDTNYIPNCTSGEIVFEATWTPAEVKNYGTAFTTNGTYETRFWIINSNITNNMSIGSACTITAMNPDGTTGNYDTYTIGSNNSNPNITANTDGVKIEFVKMRTTGNIDANGYSLTIGRGCSNSKDGGQIRGCSSDKNCNNIVKIESGKYASLRNFTSGLSTNRTCDQLMILGCDYDRAKGDNSKLDITGSMYVASSVDLKRSTGSLYVRGIIKSGNFISGVDPSSDDYTGEGGTDSYYFSVSGTHNSGRRFLTVEGGRLAGIAGGMDSSDGQSTTGRSFDLRVRGTALIEGVVYGAAEYANGKGTRTMVFTGGTVNGWVAGGANGTQTSNGALNGASYIYIGGNVQVDSKKSTKVMNRSVGGNVYGAGCGYSATSSSGQVQRGTNLVVADGAYVERGVYGGGGFGYCTNTQTANIFITGGHVDGYTGQDYNKATIQGGVYGGARQNQGGAARIYMTGGTVNTGIYGGSNYTGTMNLDVVMQIDGGTVNGNIHGGGYGTDTKVSQSVEITLGKTGPARDADGVTVYGDVYGGSALGSVNGTAATNTYHTYVTMNAGYIHGSLYGGALGNSTTAANVYGPVQVKVYGGSVMKTDENGANGSGAVYGANNINGAPQRAVTVDIYGTNSAPAEDEYALFSVYGGGNAANYTYGNGYPKVTVHNCDNSIEYVYGGGNAAAVAATDVTIYGGDKIGNVFGGGNGQVKAANVNGNTNVKIYGGTIGDVYGGSNTDGTIGGTISVNVNATAESGKSACPIDIDNVYGGGNQAASKAGSVTIGCAEHIGAVYGGANQADISGNINLAINAGHIDNVFGGNNQSGNIDGTITVTVNDNGSECGMVVGNVYGGGNLAAYGTGTNYPVVNIENGHLTGSVFGGGKGDATDESHATGAVTGNPQVTIGDTNNSHKVIIDGNVFGGGDAANVIGKPVVLVQNCNTVIGTFSDDAGTIDGTVYGGGNAAHITGAGNGTNVTINGGTIYRVFGGGNGEVKPANIEGNAVTNIHAGLIGQVFAGSNEQGSVGGTASATIDHDNTDCNEKIDEVYGGGNLAAGNAGAITVECGAIIGDLYGGANQANVTSDITLNITGGTIDRVFGGNNTSGNVMGSIIVNVQKDPTCDLDLGSVFGGGNQAAYSIYGYNTDGSAITSGTAAYNNPQVNIKNGTVKNNVYGGGLGATAKVYGAPQVTIGDNTNAEWVAAVGGDVYGGGDAAEVVGTPVVNVINKCNTTIANVYGGGNAADVSGTDVNIDGGTITGMVFGGGHGSKGDSSAEPAIPAVAANVNGNVNLDVTGGTISKVFAGSNANGNITGEVTFNINKVADHCDMKIDEVYGGGNEAAGNAATINIGCTGGEGEYIHTVYGGANAADINNDIVLNINGGHIDNAFGGNNTSGAVAGTITVNVNQAASSTECNSYLGNVYGAGNLALYTGNPAVNILNGIVSGNVYGAGKGDATDESHAPGTVTGSPVVIIGDDVAEHTVIILGNVFGGGDAANVVGTPSVTVNDCNTTIGTKSTDGEGNVTYNNGTVYGGGNAAHVVKSSETAEDGNTAVTINGGTINRIFGGGNGETKAANVAGDANTVIHAGTIHQAFAGSNAAGVISGEANITVDHDGTCDEHLDEVYGGGNLAEGNAGTVTIECGAEVGDVYGGANQANVTNDITLNITGGQINRVFGGNNTSGNISGSITVNIEIDETACENASLNYVYGAGNQAAYTPTNASGAYPAVNLKKGTVAQNVYGGGLGASATVTSNPTVTLEGVTVNGAIFGGGDAAPVTGNPTVVANYGTSANIFGGGKGETAIVTGGTHVTIDQTEGKTLSVVNVFGGGDAAAVAGSGTTLIDMKAGTVANIYGGGNQAGAASTTVNMTGGTVEKTGGATSSGIYGGCNTSGTVTGNIAVNITGGTVGTAPESETPAVESNVHGGGYGSATATNGNVTVIVNGEAVNIWGDVYGGSALGNVNDAATDQTKVQLDKGTIHGCLYGGGLGDKDNAALVNGTVNVIVNGGTVTEQVFGCNNVNGTPKSNVTVTINGTNAHTPATETTPAVYAISEVYGGGNMAHYAPTGSEVCKVIVNNCESSIGYVYGGGNAANVTSTDVTINGGIIGQVFGGGHGDKNATPNPTEANVTGNVAVKVYGGTIEQVFAGSNSKGTIDGTATLTVNKTGTCAMHINEVYGGGNEAEGHAGSVNIGCTGGEGEGIQDVYGGARNANVTSGITLNITGGNLNRVFGGNNVGGNVTGAIKVNINEDGSACGMNLNTVYGAGNMAAYTPTTPGSYPEVNIIKGTVKQNVYGGGLGSTAVVTSNPVVNIKGGTVTQDVFGGGEAANVAGSTAINVTSGTVSRDLYGGGALADVTGNTVVSLTGGTVNNVYGGGLGDASTAALINGGTTVTLNGSVVKGSVFGCNNVNGTPKGHVKVLVQNTTAQPGAGADAYHVAAVYGGGNQAAYLPTSDTDFTEVLVSGCGNSVEYVYGGGNAASTPKTQVTIEGGKMFNVFGGGNGAGAGNPGADVGYKNHNTSETYGEGTTNVNIYGGTITSVFGGSNTKGNIRVQSNVNLDDHGVCTFQVGDVYGAGNEAEMYGNGNLIIGCIPGLEEIYGGSKNADIHGDVSLTITNGEFGKVFGGNNLGGNIAGSITVNIEETGCRPIKIGELYGGGNLAAYTAPVGKTMYPEVNIKSFTTIGTVFGGGLGMTDAQIEAATHDQMVEAAKKLGKTDEQIAALSNADLKALAKTYFKSRGVIKGNPHVNIGLVEGKFANGGTYETINFPAISNKWGNKLGTIGDVYGGGNAADIDGDTYVNIATTETVTLTTGENKNPQPLKGVNISGNVYGGGNAAHVTGKTHVQVGKAPTPTPTPAP